MLNVELDNAWQIVLKTGANLFLTGKAGTGKTTFLKRLKQLSPKRMIVLAPTGVSAINAEGVTIHSFFQLPLSPYVPEQGFNKTYEKKFYVLNKSKREIIKSLDMLVIDEISMVRSDVLDAIDASLRRYRHNSLPFGGIQLIMIGDVRQLSPVVTDNEKVILSYYYETPYFFSSKALQKTNYITIELKKIYRQQDCNFINLLNNIRDNKVDEKTLSLLNERCIPNFTPPSDTNYIMLTALNKTAQHYNEQCLDKINDKAYVYTAKINGTFPESSQPTDMQLTLKQGAQIIFIKNDSINHNYYNGMIGTIVYLDENKIKVRCSDTEDEFYIEKEEWKNIKYSIDPDTKEISEKTEGTFLQYPLKLAWAITIHKSQGLTFKHAIIDVSSSFAPGQAYVALSRCKTMEGMVLLTPIRARDIISDCNVDRFVNDFNSQSMNRLQISDLERSYTISLLNDMFDFSLILQTFRLYIRIFEEHLQNKNQDFYEKLLDEETNIVNLMEVARKFQKEYTNRALLPNAFGSEIFSCRIRKAASFYQAKIQSTISLISNFEIISTNKTITKQINEKRSALIQLLSIKSTVFKHESNDSVTFTTEDYLITKSKARQQSAPQTIINTKNNKSTINKSTNKLPKIHKPKTAEISYELYKQGKEISQIAEERNLSAVTIQSHLAEYVEKKIISAQDLIPICKIEKINKAIDGLNDKGITLRKVKEVLGNDYSFGEIKIVFATRGIDTKNKS